MASDFNENRPGRTSSASRASSSSGSRSSGFQNRPRPSKQSFEHTPPPRGSGARPSRSRPARRPAARGGGLCGVESIPWNIVIPLLIAVALVVLCVVFGESILQFLSGLLSYIIVIAVLIFILKSFLFGGGRR